MAYPGTRDACEAVMPVLTEEQMASWLREDGRNIVLRRGRYWEGKHHGFYQAVHWLGRMTAKEARRPALWCYGYRTALVDEDAWFANGSVPVHLLSDVEHYDMQALPSKRRNQLRKCLKHVTLVQVTDPTILREQGYEVRCSVTQRLGIWPPGSKEEYLGGLESHVLDRRRLILAGIIDGRLGGYIEAQAVDGTAYVERVYLATEYLSKEIGTGLVYELVQACRRSGKVREIVYGWAYRWIESLVRFKYGMGFPTVHIPSRLWMAPLVRRAIRWRSPRRHFWLTGRDGLR